MDVLSRFHGNPCMVMVVETFQSGPSVARMEAVIRPFGVVDSRP